MIDIDVKQAEMAQLAQEETGDEEAALATEFKAVLKELATDLAHSATGPSLESLSEAVRSAIADASERFEGEIAKQMAPLRESHSELVQAVEVKLEEMRQQAASALAGTLSQGLKETSVELQKSVRSQLADAATRLESLGKLEAVLRQEAAHTERAASAAAAGIHQEVQAFLRAGEHIRISLASTAQQLEEQAKSLRQTIESVVPGLETASHGLQAGQENLKGLLRGYTDALEKSISAVEAKLAATLATNLEHIGQRQSDLETRVRSTAERTEEAVLDLMQGNQAHHQATVDSTAATLSQLEFFAKIFRQMHSGLNGVFFLATGALVGLTFVIYLLISRR
jgi:hypothetical protein